MNLKKPKTQHLGLQVPMMGVQVLTELGGERAGAPHRTWAARVWGRGPQFFPNPLGLISGLGAFRGFSSGS